jgi:glycosyltransferase involved in cell wall biosynthesis
MVWHSLRYADVVVCNGYAVRDTLIGPKKIKPRVVVVPNGVDGEHFRPMPGVRLTQRQRLGFTNDHFVFGTVANVRPVKNYPLLLNTMRRVAEEHPHVRLVCVGGGPQLEEMKALANRLGVGDKVIWTGQTTDIRPAVATFDAFALTSFKEGCPNALMQAMAMGVASMSSAVGVGEVPHLTESGQCGLLFDPNNQDTCVATALRLVQDASLRARLGAAGRERMLNHYSPTTMIDSYVTLFEDTAAELRGPSCPLGCAVTDRSSKPCAFKRPEDLFRFGDVARVSGPRSTRWYHAVVPRFSWNPRQVIERPLASGSP